MSRYRVAQVGIGNRGKIHANAFLELQDRFELVGLCDLDGEKLDQYAQSKGLPREMLYRDAERMLSETKPDIFCFVTQPTVRLSMVELGARHGVIGMAFEKPMARSLAEARRIRDICRENAIKAVVCHQQKYLTSFQKLIQVVRSGEIGEIEEIHGSSTGNLTDLGTHFTDYVIWANGGARAKWVVGHAHGRRELDSSHPSPDFIMARFEFENGVRGFLEIGSLSPRYMTNAPRWLDNRLKVYGTHGYVWADTDGRWGAITKSSKGEILRGYGPGYDPKKPGSGWIKQQSELIQVPYLRDLADWLDDDSRVHPSNLEQAYHGFELLIAACLSSIEHTRVDLPIEGTEAANEVFNRMRESFPDVN